MRRTFLVGVAAVAACAVVGFWPGSSASEAGAAEPASPTPLEQDRRPGEVEPLTYEAPRHTKTPSSLERPRMLELPNGEFVPALNGVRGAPPMEWPADRPFSPIIGRVRTTELEWYVHADGTRSTTQMSFRTDLSRFDAVTTLANPAPLGQIPAAEGGESR